MIKFVPSGDTSVGRLLNIRCMVTRFVPFQDTSSRSFLKIRHTLPSIPPIYSICQALTSKFRQGRRNRKSGTALFELCHFQFLVISFFPVRSTDCRKGYMSRAKVCSFFPVRSTDCKKRVYVPCEGFSSPVSGYMSRA